MNQVSMDMNFSGQLQPLVGQIQWKSSWDALKKGALSCLIAWLLGVFLLIVPFVNWTMPAVFFAFGPIMAVAVFFMDRRFVNRLDASAVCPKCGSDFEIHEKDVAPPIYGNCPACRLGFQLNLPEKA